ncbi:MAG: autotransporter domain-containing protein [Candidatus Competibacteraceae bacterium]|nr:autotransporter domain-containing protein [Candidatus Competibacteraceae bacterium]
MSDNSLTVVEDPQRMADTGLVINEGLLEFAGGTLSTPALANEVGGLIEGHGRLEAGVLNNAGTMVAAANGTLTLSGDGTHTGILQALEGAVLEFATGGHDLFDGSVVGGDGTVHISGATVSSDTAGYALAGTTELSGGVLELLQDATTGRLTQSDGILTGPGELTVSGATRLTGGIQTGAGTTVAQGGLEVDGAVALSQRVLENRGGALISGSLQVGGFDGSEPGGLVNAAGATLELAGEVFGRGGFFDNPGTITATEGVIDTFLTNSGAVQVQPSGNLVLGGGGEHSGDFQIGEGGSLIFDAFEEIGHTLTGGTVSGSGSVAVVGDERLVVDTAGYALAGSTVVSDSARLSFLQDASTGTLLQNGGTLSGPGDLLVRGDVRLNGGVQTGGGRTIVEGALQFDPESFVLDGGRILENRGQLLIEQAQGIDLNAGSDPGAGRVVNAPEGTVELLADVLLTVSDQGSGDDGSDAFFDNQGAFLKSGGDVSLFEVTSSNSGTLELGSGTLDFGRGLTNSGMVLLAGGDLAARDYTQSAGTTTLEGNTLSSIDGVAIQGGSLTGNGTIDGDLVVAGTLAPGASVGALSVTGDFELTGGLLALELAGPDSFDTLSVGGSATLGADSTIQVRLLEGFTPTAGDRFDVLSASHITGPTDLAGLFDLPALEADLSFQVDIIDDMLRLSVAALGTLEAVWQGGEGDWSTGPWAFGAPPVAAEYPDNDTHNRFDVIIDGDETSAARVSLVDVDPTIDSLTVTTDDTLVLGASRTLSVVADPQREGTGLVSNAGTLEFRDATLTALRLNNAATGRLEGTGTVAASTDNAGTIQVDSGTLAFSRGLTNSGTVLLTGGDVTTTRYTQSGGTTTLGGGTLTASDRVDIQGGRLQGSGTIDGHLTVTATLAPGAASVGTLNVTGDFTLPAGLLEVQVAGAGSFDLLAVDGMAGVGAGATLRFASLNGFTAQTGQSFRFLTADSVTLAPEASLDFAALAANGEPLVTLDSNALVLTIAPQGISGGGDISPAQLLEGRGDLDLRPQTITIGGSRSGNLTLSDGRRIESSALTLGGTGGAGGTLTVRGGGTQLLLDRAGAGGESLVTVGRSGTGALTIDQGALVRIGRAAGDGQPATTGQLILGREAGGSGQVSVRGSGSRLNLVGAGSRIRFGAGGGTLTVGSGAEVRATQVLANSGAESRIVLENNGLLIAGVRLGDGGILAGRGRVRGTVAVDGGTLSPGSSPGILTIEGDLNMDSGVLAIELAGTEEGRYDRLAVTGSASLSGGRVEFSLLEGFTPEVGDSFTFLTAAEGLTAYTPTATRLPTVAGLRFRVAVGDNGATLVTRAPIPPEVTERLPQNVRDIGQAALAFCDFNPLDPSCTTLLDATDEELQTALEEIAVEEVTAPVDSALSNVGAQLRNISVRIASLRAGGAEVGGLVMDPAGHALASGHLQDLIGLSGGGASADGVAADFGRWGMYVQGSVGNGDKDATEQEAAFDYDSHGITVGADYRLNDQLIVGAAMGYSKTDGEFGDRGGDLQSEGFNLTAYSTWYRDEAFYLDATLMYGVTDYDQNRRLAYTAGGIPVGQLFHADYDGDQTMISLGGGNEFNRGPLTYGPVGRLEYLRTRIDGLDETASRPDQAGAAWAVNTEDQTVHSLTTSLGGQVSYAVSTSWGVVVPNARVEWVHEFRDDARTVTGWFAGREDDTFGIRTDAPDRNYVNALVGASAVLPGGATAYGYVESVLGRDDQRETAVGLGARWEFW